jgi:hypothetical protein
VIVMREYRLPGDGTLLPDFDVQTALPPRMCNYFLGGQDNFGIPSSPFPASPGHAASCLGLAGSVNCPAEAEVSKPGSCRRRRSRDGMS